MEGQISGKFGFRIVGSMGKLSPPGMSFSMKKRAENWRRKYQQRNRLFSTKSVSSRDLQKTIQLHQIRFDRLHHLQDQVLLQAHHPSPQTKMVISHLQQKGGQLLLRHCEFPPVRGKVNIRHVTARKPPPCSL